MTNEWIEIVEELYVETQKGGSCVLASLVDLEGSSYRKPGVRLLIKEDNSYVGSLSAGCLEGYVANQAETVFKTGQAKVFQFDGKNGIGCGGLLTILLEPIDLTLKEIELFKAGLVNRSTIQIRSAYNGLNKQNLNSGSTVEIQGQVIPLSQDIKEISSYDYCFDQTIEPQFKLLIFGTEKDAFVLYQVAQNLGWDVVLINSKDVSQIKRVDAKLQSFDSLQAKDDTNFSNTGAVIMNHNFELDKNCLQFIANKKLMYVGVLGPKKRTNELKESLNTTNSANNFEFLHGPVGLNINAETPAEIAISILAEIIAVTKKNESIINQKVF